MQKGLVISFNNLSGIKDSSFRPPSILSRGKKEVALQNKRLKSKEKVPITSPPSLHPTRHLLIASPSPFRVRPV